MNPTLSAIIPVYCGAATIEDVVRGIIRQFDQLGLQGEVILVDDASPDHSWEVLQKLYHEHPRHIRLIQLMRNFGQHNAIMCGLRHARGDYILTMDDDGQHPPEEIPKLLQTLKKTGADVTYGVPREREGPLFRKLGSWLIVRFFRIVFRHPVTPSAFRIMTRQVARAILCYDLNFTYIDGLLAWHTHRLTEVTVEHRPRKVGRSQYTFGKLVLLAMNLFTNFSLLPLQIVSLLGFSVALGGVTLGFYYLVRKILGGITVPGYASIIVAVLVLGGLQMLCLGIIGEYLGRIHLNINRRPQYVVRQVIGVETNASAREFEDCGDKPVQIQ